MSWKCDKCRKLYKYIHDGNPKNPRLKQMMMGKFICDKCNDTLGVLKKVPTISPYHLYSGFESKIIGAIL